jgi:hypothetical protein
MLVRTTAAAETNQALYLLAIGYNGVPAEAVASGVVPLRFADDDAARIYGFARELGGRARLLTIFDRDTATRLPELVSQARPPTLVELRAAVAALNFEMDAAARSGREPSVVLFYSGHGTRKDDGRGALTLQDGELTQAVLYDEVLSNLHARFVHLLVDACHAEATVRPRDTRARAVDISTADLTAYVNRTTLARFPGVGAIVASSNDAQAHEWDLYQGGVFTHEVLSGLRGGADVNGDRRIEYSEMAAFLAAANRSVIAAQARLETVVHAPTANPRTALITLHAAPQGAWIQGVPSQLGALHLEDERGERLLDLKAERGHQVTLLVPAEVPLFLRTVTAEAWLRLRMNERIDFKTLNFADRDARPRGALASALRQGLFATEFGPAYYRGFIDNQNDLVAVDFPLDATSDAAVLADRPAKSKGTARRRAVSTWLAFGVSAALTATATTFSLLTWRAREQYRETNLERDAESAKQRFYDRRTVALVAAGGAAVAAGVGLLLSWLERDEAMAAGGP